jgi:hypothetical protein
MKLSFLGPFRYPIVGNLPQIAALNWSRVYEACHHLCHTKGYGPIMGLWFGPRYVGMWTLFFEKIVKS